MDDDILKKNLFIEILFLSKLLNFNIYMFNLNKNIKKYEEEELINFFKKKDLIFLFNISINLKKTILFCTKGNFKNLNKIDNSKIIFISNEYKYIFDYIINNIKLVNLKKEDTIIIWKNQYIISSLLDYYDFDFLNKNSNNLYSINFDLNDEKKFNNKILIDLNKWYDEKKINNENQMNFEKIKYIIS